jgi:hypothetical protein
MWDRDVAYCLARLGRHEETVPYMKACIKVVERIAPAAPDLSLKDVGDSATSLEDSDLAAEYIE